MERVKQTDTHVVCGSVQSVALHLEEFKDNAFDYLIIDEYDIIGQVQGRPILKAS